ncbi:hypothetical protein JCM9140_1545 [Halalkalibacter wakoensis JCM 9140]|uniref:Uncharacterized protein n=1 Tax=Halalkalibacter wakoensis JCM 9140 TaxID=1236970 RepID=W4Q0T0_9BACI|nr:hypothetical protein [Halalkalibacter wakoensis]GAE25545.1 hypothetical protein JCM9140_1545 [Halalkalibacter wakoensis JCM 9140]
MNEGNVDLLQIRRELSIKGKNGIGFILAAAAIWTIITIIFALPIETHAKNILMLFTTGLLFPLAVVTSKLLKADWRFENNPLANLATHLNVAQIMYFPILFWAIAYSPNEAVLFFAIIVGAHFFPYGWFYHTKAFYFMAPVISALMILIWSFVQPEQLWLIPLSMVLLLLLLALWLYNDYKRKVKL